MIKVDFKRLFLRLWALIVNPRQAWSDILEEDPRQDVAMTFVFPLTCCCGLAILIGRLIRDGFAEGGFLNAFADAAIACLGLVAAFYLATAIVDQLSIRLLKQEPDKKLSALLVGYSFAVVFALTMLVGLFPAWVLFKWVLQFYVVYVVWVGAEVLMHIDEDRRMTFSLLTSAAILLIPFLIQLIFNKMPLAFG